MPERGRKVIETKLKRLGLTRNEAETVTDTLIETISEGLEKDGKVIISGFGRFGIRRQRPRRTQLPGQEPTLIPERFAVRFKASPKLFGKFLKMKPSTSKRTAESAGRSDPR